MRTSGAPDEEEEGEMEEQMERRRWRSKWKGGDGVANGKRIMMEKVK